MLAPREPMWTSSKTSQGPAKSSSVTPSSLTLGVIAVQWYPPSVVRYRTFPAVAHPWRMSEKAHVNAVVVMAYSIGQDSTDKPAIRHQVHFSVHCDGRAVALAARILGASAPRLAEQYLGQLQVFYGGLAWYLDQDEERGRAMFHKAGVAWPWSRKR